MHYCIYTVHSSYAQTRRVSQLPRLGFTAARETMLRVSRRRRETIERRDEEEDDRWRSERERIDSMMDKTAKLRTDTSVLCYEDVMLNILCRLPVKTLSRFRCVSKQWCFWLTSPYFVKLQLNQATEISSMINIFSIENTALSIWSFEDDRLLLHQKIGHPKIFHSDPRKRYVWEGHPCNGLFCYSTALNICVWNPAIQEVFVVREEDPHLVSYLRLIRALGFCPSTNEYKLVRVFRRMSRSKPRTSPCHLLTLKGSQKSTWREIEDLPCPVKFQNPALVRGAFYFLTERVFLTLTSSSDFIVCLDLEHEKCRVVPHPNGWLGDVYPNVPTLQELSGNLCLIDMTLDQPILHIWMVTDYTNYLWERLYSINPERTIPSFPRKDGEWYVDLFAPLAICSGGKLLVIIDNQVLGYYDAIRGTFEKLFEFKDLAYRRVHVESLVSPLNLG